MAYFIIQFSKFSCGWPPKPPPHMDPSILGLTLLPFSLNRTLPDQVNDRWYIPAVPTGKLDFGAPNCPVRALRYYHRYMTEHPELSKGYHPVTQA